MANRKKESKDAKKALEVSRRQHPYDDMDTWLMNDALQAPWTKEKIADFQRKINSAFGAEDALILAWSGDRTYWDEFYIDWHPTGLPKGAPEKKPSVLFGCYYVNNYDYVYVSVPRWVIYERQHISQLEESWESSAWVLDKDGQRRRIRSEKPPKNFYSLFAILAEHDKSILIGGTPPCCEGMWETHQRICYGRYREPSEVDLRSIREIRERMDADGMVQRSDADRTQKLLTRGNMMTQMYIKQCEEQQSRGNEERIMNNIIPYFGRFLEARGSTLSAKEVEQAIHEGVKQSQAEREQETL